LRVVLLPSEFFVGSLSQMRSFRGGKGKNGFYFEVNKGEHNFVFNFLLFLGLMGGTLRLTVNNCRTACNGVFLSTEQCCGT